MKNSRAGFSRELWFACLFVFGLAFSGCDTRESARVAPRLDAHVQKIIEAHYSDFRDALLRDDIERAGKYVAESYLTGVGREGLRKAFRYVLEPEMAMHVDAVCQVSGSKVWFFPRAQQSGGITGLGVAYEKGSWVFTGEILGAFDM